MNDLVFDSCDRIDPFSPTVGEQTPLHGPTCVVMLVVITSVAKQIEKGCQLSSKAFQYVNVHPNPGSSCVSDAGKFKLKEMHYRKVTCQMTEKEETVKYCLRLPEANC